MQYYIGMQKRTREIIALVLLVVLGIGGISAMAWYLLVGHNWNEAASNIDDRFGSMDGYTVVLYEGVIPATLDDFVASITHSEPESKDAADVAGSGSGDSDGEAVDGSAAVVDEASAAGANADAAESGDALDEALTLESAIASYREKDAAVVFIHTDDLQRYVDPVIVPRNGQRIAVFAALGPRPDLVSKTVVKDLRHRDVDIVICIVDDLEAVERGLGDVDIAICTDKQAAGRGGRYIGKTFTVGSPYTGQIGAVVMAPSGFLSAKTLVEL